MRGRRTRKINKGSREMNEIGLDRGKTSMVRERKQRERENKQGREG